MPVLVGGIKIGYIQSGASMNNGEISFTSTHKITEIRTKRSTSVRYHQ